jgi:hypothetical protein
MSEQDSTGSEWTEIDDTREWVQIDMEALKRNAEYFDRLILGHEISQCDSTTVAGITKRIYLERTIDGLGEASRPSGPAGWRYPFPG